MHAPGRGLLLAGVPVILLVLIAVQAVPSQGPTVTYTISLHDDGSAIWNTEYRTPLSSQGDLAAFQNYSEDIQTVYLPDYTQLMKQSAADASTATGRPVGVSDFTADSTVQSGPTGSYGVVHYRCSWSGFARTGDLLTVGDVFIGGIYLGRDNTLIIQPPPGFVVEEASPLPDATQDGLSWYGLRSFGAGEPRVVFGKEPFPWVPIVIVILIAGGLGGGIYTYRRRSSGKPPVPGAGTAPGPVDPGPPMELEERILALLGEKGGALFQSEIVEGLGLPKSTVSEAINRLHEAGRIEKVRKGRENLIRLPSPDVPDRQGGPFLR